jgi:ankyrin repeat protein
VDSAGLTPLQYSVQNSHWEVVELLLEKRNPSATLNIDAVDSEGRTPLQFAVMNGQMEVVRLLLEREGINIDAVDRAGLTPLQYSVRNRNWEVAELLLTKGKPTLNIDAVGSEGGTPLQVAIVYERMEVVRLLLEREGINIDAVDSEGRTPLHIAIEWGRMEVVKLLLEREGINIDAVDSTGRTPIHIAIECGRFEAVRLLVEREGFNIDAVDSTGRTPLHFAIECGRMAVVRLLVGREGINIDAVDSAGLTPLQYSVQNSHWEVVELLLEKRNPFATLNIDAVDSEGRTPLQFAVMNRRMAVVRLLLEREGINIDAVDRAGLTPLQYSVQNSHWEVAELLLEKGNPFAKLDYHGQCDVFEGLLHLATKNEKKTIAIQLLNTLGSRMNDFADRSTKFPGNQSLSGQSRLLASAAVSNHLEIIKYIVKWQPEVNVNEMITWAAIPDLVATPLHFAAVAGDVATVGGPKRGHVQAVQELLEHPKLDVNAQDNKKKTPLLYAIEAGNVDMVKVLCQNDKFQRLRATEENSDGHTPLQIVVEANNLSEDPDMKAMEKVLLERPEVKDFVERLYRDRQVFVDAANALLVGAALIASVTYAGWLQPPLGYTPYYDFSQPFPAPPGAYESYAAIKQNPKVKAFWVFNSLSFFFAIATVLAGADAAMPSLDDAFIARVVKSVRRSLIVASILLVMSVVCVLGAFASGGFAVLPPLLKYDTSMIITVCVGGTVCMIILAKFLWKLAKATRVRLLKRAMKHCPSVEGGHCSPTCIGNGS